MNRFCIYWDLRFLLILCIMAAALICITGCFVKSSSTCKGDTCEGIGETGDIQYPDATPADSPSKDKQTKSTDIQNEGKGAHDASQEHKKETVDMPSSKTITIYTMETCPHCQQLKKFLSQKEIEYREIEVDIDPYGAEEMYNISNQTSVPVIVINDEVIVGFDRRALEKKLRKAGF